MGINSPRKSLTVSHMFKSWKIKDSFFQWKLLRPVRFKVSSNARGMCSFSFWRLVQSQRATAKVLTLNLGSYHTLPGLLLSHPTMPVMSPPHHVCHCPTPPCLSLSHPNMLSLSLAYPELHVQLKLFVNIIFRIFPLRAFFSSVFADWNLRLH